MSYEIIEKLKKAITEFEDIPEATSMGEVVEIADGVAKVSGLRNVQNQELLSVQTSGGKIKAVAFSLEEEFIGAVILGEYKKIKTGDHVSGSGEVLSIKVSEEMKGRVVNPLGEPLDGKGPIFQKTEGVSQQIERRAPNVLNRESVNRPLHTGIKAIDSMIPIGRGQRELIIGDRQTGKTTIAIDTIINQSRDSDNPPICIYVAIGQKQANIARVVKTLEEADALSYTIIVSANASSPTTLWYLAPYAGAAIGEYFMDKGEDALVIYDDLSKHATAYREISLLLRRPPGREAFPGDVFYLHSRLLERAAKRDQEGGGGSLTALPIIETQLGDVSAYIPTNVISITDGQIYLESNLFNKGIRPAVNAGLSVSRVGSSAQTKAIKKVAGKLRLELAQFRELQAFVQFASDLDEATRQRINRGQMLTEILKQPDGQPMPFEHQVIIFYAAVKGFFDNVPVEELRQKECELIDYAEKLHKDDILNEIKLSEQLTGEMEQKLTEALKQFLITGK